MRCLRWSVCLTGRKSLMRMYHESAIGQLHKASDAHMIDIRSDTLTTPTKAMREAMANAKVGDAVFGEDPTANALEEKVAKMLGKEAGLYVPSGTMSNLIGLMAHCSQRGQEIITGDKSHIFLYEQGGMAQIGGINPRLIINKDDGTFDLEELETKIRPLNDPHQPRTKMVCLENTHNYVGGKVLPLNFIKQVREVAERHNLVLHLDGARLLNAAVVQNVDPVEICQHFHSVSLCLSKGLGAPIGSVLVGSKDLINLGVRIRKVLGGGMRQAGVIAAPAMLALDDYTTKLKRDHQNAQALAQGINKKKNSIIAVDSANVHTNIIMIRIIKDGLTSEQFANRLSQVTEEEVKTLNSVIKVRMLPWAKTVVRCVTHCDLDSSDIERTLQKIYYVVEEMESL